MVAYVEFYIKGEAGDPIEPPRYISSVEEMAGEALNGKDKGPLSTELCSRMNAFRIGSFFARKPEIGAKLKSLGWSPVTMASELNDKISNVIFARIEEALHVLAWGEAQAGPHVHHTMTAIWDWAENSPQNLIMNTAYHVESYYWNSQADDLTAKARLARAKNFAHHCGQGEPIESNVHVLNITKISLGFLEYATPLFTHGPREEDERLEIANRMNQLGWERDDVKFLLSLEGEQSIYGHAIERIQVTSLIKLAIRKGVEGVVIRRMAELFEKNRSAGMIFYHFQMAQEARRFDTDFFLNHELNY